MNEESVFANLWQRARTAWPRRNPAVREETLKFSFAGSPRTVRLYLPPCGPVPNTPVFVALDGQTMRHWRLTGALAALARNALGPAPLVIAIPASRHRLEEYGMADRRDYAGRGKLARDFQRTVVNTVLPTVIARYGLQLLPERMGIFGASMGGLSAFDTAWRHPDVFGFAGIFSGSLWWRGSDANPIAQQNSRLAHQLVRDTVMKPALRLWFQAGTADETEDRDGNGVIDAIQDTTELIDELVAKGFQRGRDVEYHEIRGGEHNERTWARALPKFLDWALRSQARTR